MKQLKIKLTEALNHQFTYKFVKGKKYVKNNELIDDEKLKQAILDETISPEDAEYIFNQYEWDDDGLEEAGYDSGYIDDLSSKYDNFKDYHEREYKGSICGYIDEILDICEVDEWWYGLLVIINKYSVF